MTSHNNLRNQITGWSESLGFDHTGFTNTQLGIHETRFLNWLDAGYHGDMDYMQRHSELRLKPSSLHEGTISIISVRMNYLLRTGARLSQTDA